MVFSVLKKLYSGKSAAFKPFVCHRETLFCHFGHVSRFILYDFSNSDKRTNAVLLIIISILRVSYS